MPPAAQQRLRWVPSWPGWRHLCRSGSEDLTHSHNFLKPLCFLAQPGSGALIRASPTRIPEHRISLQCATSSALERPLRANNFTSVPTATPRRASSWRETQEDTAFELGGFSRFSGGSPGRWPLCGVYPGPGCAGSGCSPPALWPLPAARPELVKELRKTGPEVKT